MKAIRVLLALLCLFALSGCDSLHRDQIRVGSSIGGLLDSERQEAEVVRALALVARRFGFSDELRHARMEGVLAYYVEEAEDFPIVLGARRIGGALIVDIRQFAPGTRESARYVAVRAAIAQELSVSLGAGSVTLLERQHHQQ